LTIVIAPEGGDDIAAIADAVARAFGRADEALLVEALRQSGDLAVSLVARDDRAIVGHIAFQPLTLDPPPSTPLVAMSLAPVSVLPDHHRRGIGTALIRAGLEKLTSMGCDIVFVLGDPGYYGRFGFRAETALPFSVPWAGPHFQALRLSNRPLPSAAELAYPAAFFGGVA